MASDKELQEIINAYNVLVKGINQKAIDNQEGRAYGGIVRAGKGEMVESIAKVLVRLAWKDLGQREVTREQVWKSFKERFKQVKELRMLKRNINKIKIK